MHAGNTGLMGNTISPNAGTFHCRLKKARFAFGDIQQCRPDFVNSSVFIVQDEPWSIRQKLQDIGVAISHSKISCSVTVRVTKGSVSTILQ